MLLGLEPVHADATLAWPRGRRPRAARIRGHWLPVGVFALAVVTVAALALSGRLVIDPVRLAAAASWLIALFAVAYFAYLILLRGP